MGVTGRTGVAGRGAIRCGPRATRSAGAARGSPGPVGDRGLSGSPGATGPQGLRGEQGRPPGCQGLAGLRGEPGSPGERGVEGPVGQRGDPGDKGPTGDRREAPSARKGLRVKEARRVAADCPEKPVCKEVRASTGASGISDQAIQPTILLAPGEAASTSVTCTSIFPIAGSTPTRVRVGELRRSLRCQAVLNPIVDGRTGFIAVARP